MDFHIDVLVQESHWRTSARRISERIRREPGPAESTGVEPHNLWFYGPESLVKFVRGGVNLAYEGSLFYLASGLAEWYQTGSEAFILPGESVWQTPDVRIAKTNAGTILTLDYSPAVSLQAPPEDFRSGVASLLSSFADELTRRVPDIDRVRGLGWFVDFS